MTAKEYLNQYREAILRVQAMTDHMAELRSECDLLRTQNGERVRLDAAVADLVDTGEQIGRQTQHMKELQQEVSRIILMVTDADRRVLLTLVYIEGKTLRQAASVMNYSYRQVKRIHHHALHDVAVILSQNEKKE